MVAGNVVEDRQPDGSWSPGGPSLYSARMAQALGARVTLVTGLPDGYDHGVLTGLDVVSLPATDCPRYENRYLPGGVRQQLLFSEGASFANAPWDRLPAADVFIIAPAFHELLAAPPCAAALRAISLQGVLRERLPDNRIRARRDALEAARDVVARGDLVFFSDEDTGEPAALAGELAHDGATVVVTHGEGGATLHTAERAETFAALPARTVDPTGAGDCFATAFAVRYRETASLERAMRFGLAAGAAAVEAPGLLGIPSRAAIEARAGEVAA